MGVSQTQRCGVALIGAGMVAKTHLAAIEDASPKLRLTGVLARRPESAQALIERAGQGAQVYADIDALLADEAVDFAILITPPNARLELVQALVTAGLPILMEKPVARTLAEAAAVVDLCDAAATPLGVVLQHRFRQASLDALRLVESGRLGALYLAEISVPWWREQSYYDEPGRGTYARDGGGVLISQAIHTIDLALAFTGPMRAVQAMTATTQAHQMEAEDFAVAGLRFANGAVGSLTASTASFPGAAEGIVLHFQNGSLRLQSGVLVLDWRDGRQETFGETAATGGGADPMAFTHAWHQSVIEDFAAAIRSGTAPRVTGRDALAAHVLIDAIETSAKTGRRIEVSP